MAQAVRRLGGEVALVESSGHVLPREAGAARDALGEVLHRDGIEVVINAPRPQPVATVTTSSSSLTTAASCAAIACSSPPAGGRA